MTVGHRTTKMLWHFDNLSPSRSAAAPRTDDDDHRTLAHAASRLARRPRRAGWSTSPAGACRCSTRRSSKSTTPRARGRRVRHQAHGPAAVPGENAARFLIRWSRAASPTLEAGQIRYGLVCNDDGGILDDVLVYGGNSTTLPYSMVVNASNREKIVLWLDRKKTLVDRNRRSDIVDRNDRCAGSKGDRIAERFPGTEFNPTR